MTINKKDLRNYPTIDPVKFWAAVDIGEATECWEWKRSTNTTGYGLFHVRSPEWLYEQTGKTYTQLLAHRVAKFLTDGHIGEIGSGRDYILHSCDNRKCCNPKHMRVGSMLENVHDMIDKQRGFWQK